MAIKSFLHRSFLSLVVVAGLVPLFYFVSTEIEVARAYSGDSPDSTAAAQVERLVENVAWGVGERLEFDINYGFINAGTASMNVRRLVEYKGRPCYQLETMANSNSFFSTFYKVEDRVESIVDAIGIYSWRFEKNLREGGYRSDREYVFDQRNQLVYYEGDTISIAPVTHDPLSVLYYVRTQELRVGESIWVDNFTDGDKYLLEVKVLGRETVEVEAGVFDCIVVEPVTKSVGIFKHEGRLRVWLTDDRVKMPVLMKSKIVVGSITAELTDYQLGEIEVF